jgi:hypothetical protein
MSKESPTNDPIQWFFNACLLILFGTIALTVAIDLLQSIWPWVLGFMLIAGGTAIAVVVWRFWRRPW